MLWIDPIFFLVEEIRDISKGNLIVTNNLCIVERVNTCEGWDLTAPNSKNPKTITERNQISGGSQIP